MQWWVRLSMETKRPCACRHMSAPDRPDAGRRFLPSERGPVTIQVVQDLMRGPGLRGGPDSSGGPEPQLLALERLPLPGHVERVRIVVGRTGLRTAGVRMLGCSQG